MGHITVQEDTNYKGILSCRKVGQPIGAYLSIKGRGEYLSGVVDALFHGVLGRLQDHVATGWSVRAI